MRANKDIHLTVGQQRRGIETAIQDFAACAVALWVVGYRDGVPKIAAIAAVGVTVGRLLMD